MARRELSSPSRNCPEYDVVVIGLPNLQSQSISWRKNQFLDAADSMMTCYMAGWLSYIVQVDRHAKGTYITAVLRLVGVNDSAWHNYEFLRCLLRVFAGPFIVLECCPRGTIFDLHYARLGVTSALWEECHCVTTTKCLNRSTKKSLTILALAVHWYVPRAVEDFAQHRIREEAGYIG